MPCRCCSRLFARLTLLYLSIWRYSNWNAHINDGFIFKMKMEKNSIEHQQPPQLACNYSDTITYLGFCKWIKKMRLCISMRCMVVIPIQLSDHKVFFYAFAHFSTIYWQLLLHTLTYYTHSFISCFGLKREHTFTDVCRRHIRSLMRSSSLLLYCFCFCHRPIL